MRIESRRRGVLERTRYDLARRTALTDGPSDHRLHGRSVGRLPQHAVVGLPARCERRARGCGVGYAIVGRVGRDEGDVLRAVERHGLVPAFDHQQRHLRQSHTVADHVDQIFHLAAGRSRPGMHRPERQCECAKKK